MDAAHNPTEYRPQEAAPLHTYASAGGVVLDASGEKVLVLIRPERVGPDGRAEVRLPKGHIEPSESREEAALREVQEETGLISLRIVADLGHQTVEFDWQGAHYIRDESYFLMIVDDRSASGSGQPEKQFICHWLPWQEALDRLTFPAEREWVRRAQAVCRQARSTP